MENFFLYISKPVDGEEFDFWVDSNNICYLKMELFQDFVISLVNSSLIKNSWPAPTALITVISSLGKSACSICGHSGQM